MSDVATVTELQSFRDAVESKGYAIAEGVIDGAKVETLRTAIAELPEGEEVRRKTNVYGVRNLLEVSDATRQLAALPALRRLATAVLGEGCFAVRATFFDKVDGANWSLRWHQDGVITVRDRVETPGFHAWAEKAGTWHVRPPTKVLASMVALRVHLDDCPADNGALQVLAGSHGKWWPREELDEAKRCHDVVTCEVGVGGVLAMRPMLLHASGPADRPRHRRVIHIEFANVELPGDLQWRSRVAS